MVPPRMPSRHDDDDERTDLDIPSARVLLANLLRESNKRDQEVEELRLAVEGVAGVVRDIKNHQQGISEKLLDHERRITDVEKTQRDAYTDTALYRARTEGQQQLMRTQIDLMAPLVAQHERITQQGQGFVAASKLVWGVVGFLGCGALVALGKALFVFFGR